MKKRYIIISIITTILFLILFVINQKNYVSTKDRVLHLLDDVDSVFIKRENTYFTCDNPLEITIDDSKRVEILKSYVRKNIDNIGDDSIKTPAAIFSKYEYSLEFLESGQSLFEVSRKHLILNGTLYSMPDLNNYYYSLVEDTLKDLDDCYPAYQDYLEKLENESDV